MIGSCHGQESQQLLAQWQTLDGLVEFVCESAELGKMSADEYHERSKANDNKVWAPCRLCGLIYSTSPQC